MFKNQFSDFFVIFAISIINSVGTAVFGPVGAVAGVGGKKTYTVTYRCTGCGRTKTITYDKNGNYTK